MAEALTEDHELQVQSYLRFARMKRDQHLREVTGVIEDVRDYRVEETVYTKPDVLHILESLQDEIALVVEKELSFTAHSNALLLRLLFKQAEDESIQLSVDPNALENELLINQMKVLEDQALTKPASAFILKKSGLGKLSNAGGGTDPKIVMERDQLKDELQSLRFRFQELQASTNSMMKEKSAMREEMGRAQDSASTQQSELEGSLKEREAILKKKEEELAHLERAMEETGREKSALSAASSEAEEKLKKQVAKLKKEVKHKDEEISQSTSRLESADKHMDGKLNESKQFQTMKKMMMTKSQQLMQLRKRLAMYEPPDEGEDIGDADA